MLMEAMYITHIYIYNRTHIYIYILVHVCVYLNIYIRTFIYTRTYIYIYIYSYIYIIRCQASVVAVTTAIALMLQRRPEHTERNGTYNIKAIVKESFEHAQKCLPDKEAVSIHILFLFRGKSSLKVA